MPHPDFNSLLTLLLWGFGGVVLIAAGRAAIRRGTDLLVQRTSLEWERLAKAREESLTDAAKREAELQRRHDILEMRVSNLIDHNEHLAKMNQELQTLNIGLQNQTVEYQRRIATLEERIRQMELKCQMCRPPQK